MMAGEGQRDGIEGAASGNASVWARGPLPASRSRQKYLNLFGGREICRHGSTPYQTY